MKCLNTELSNKLHCNTLQHTATMKYLHTALLAKLNCNRLQHTTSVKYLHTALFAKLATHCSGGREDIVCAHRHGVVVCTLLCVAGCCRVGQCYNVLQKLCVLITMV